MNAIGVKVSKNQKCNFTPTSNVKSRDLKVFRGWNDVASALKSILKFMNLSKGGKNVNIAIYPSIMLIVFMGPKYFISRIVLG